MATSRAYSSLNWYARLADFSPVWPGWTVKSHRRRFSGRWIQSEQFRGRRIELWLGGRECHVDFAPILARLLLDGGQVFKLDRVVFGRGAQAILRAPGGIRDEVVESNFPPCSGPVDDDDRIAFGAGRARGQLGELAIGKFRGFRVRLELLLDGDRGGCFLDPRRRSCKASVDPAQGIRRVIEQHGLAAQMQRPDRVDHHRQLIGGAGIPAGHDRTRVRPVRDTAGMQRE
jgi:hypothetical protein